MLLFFSLNQFLKVQILIFTKISHIKYLVSSSIPCEKTNRKKEFGSENSFCIYKTSHQQLELYGSLKIKGFPFSSVPQYFQE